MRKPKFVMATSSKANVAKTTVLFLTAWRLALAGYRVHVDDADPEHESMARWLSNLDKLNDGTPTPFTWGTAYTKSEIAEIPNDTTDKDIVLIDIQGGNSKLAQKAAEYADLAIVCSSDSALEYITVREAFNPIRLGEADSGNTVDKALLFTRIAPHANTKVRELNEGFMDRQAKAGIPVDNRIAVFDNYFPRYEVYKNVAFRHPESFNDLDLTADGHIGKISGEMTDALGLETPHETHQ